MGAAATPGPAAEGGNELRGPGLRWAWPPRLLRNARLPLCLPAWRGGACGALGPGPAHLGWQPGRLAPLCCVWRLALVYFCFSAPCVLEVKLRPSFLLAILRPSTFFPLFLINKYLQTRRVQRRAVGWFCQGGGGGDREDELLRPQVLVVSMWVTRSRGGGDLVSTRPNSFSCCCPFGSKELSRKVRQCILGQ